MSAVAVESVFDACPGLRSLEDEVRSQLAAISRIVEVAANAVLCRQGGPPDALRYLLEGQVSLTQSANGDNAVIDVLHPVSSLALSSIVGDQPHLMTARTMRASRLLEIPAPPLRRMMDTRPGLAISMLRGVSQEVEAATRQVLDLKLRSSAQRLGCYLLSLVLAPAQQPVTLRLPYQKRLLAARLGCRYENLSRAFAVLREFGVETHGSRVVLHDLARLHAFAGSDTPLPSPSQATAAAFSQAFEL